MQGAMFYRVVSGLFGITAAGAFIAAGYLYFEPPREASHFVVEEPERVLENLVPGQQYDVNFVVRNQTGRPLRVLGNLCG